MEEEMIRDINEAGKRFIDAILATIEPIMEWANETAASLIEALDAAFELVESASDIYELCRKAQRDIEKRKKERSKWRRMTPPIIRPLLLDKRSKIHRCRNAI